MNMLFIDGKNSYFIEYVTLNGKYNSKLVLL